MNDPISVPLPAERKGLATSVVWSTRLASDVDAGYVHDSTQVLQPEDFADGIANTVTWRAISP
jgi:hypothetical protein